MSEPRPSTTRRSTWWHHAVPGSLLLLAGAYFAITVAFAGPAMTTGLAAWPWPDGAEYLDGAVSLARGEGHMIHVGGGSYPSRYPPAYSLLIAAAIKAGVPVIDAPHVVNGVAAALLVALVVGLFLRRGRFWEGALTALLLVTLPAFVVLARSPMSEVSSTLFLALGIGLLFRYAVPNGRLWHGRAGALLLGLAGCFRSSNVFFFVFLPAAWWAHHRQLNRKALVDLFGIGAASLVGASAILAYNWAHYGHPLATGYGYWIPYWDTAKVFDGQFIGQNLQYYWLELWQREASVHSAHHYGRGSYFGPAYVLLVLITLPTALRRRTLRWFVLAGLAHGVLMLSFATVDARMMFSLLALSAPVVSLALVEQWQAKGPTVRGLLVVAVVMAVLGWPSGQGGFASYELLSPRHGDAGIMPARLVSRLLESEPSPHLLVLTDLAPPYVHALLPAGAHVAPLFNDHLYRFNPDNLTFEEDERVALIAQALRDDREIWILTTSTDVAQLAGHWQAPYGYAWEVVASEYGYAGIARLVPRLLDPTPAQG